MIKKEDIHPGMDILFLLYNAIAGTIYRIIVFTV